MEESVRHLAASAGSRLAVGAFEERVEIWELKTAERVNGFSTVLDFGGERLGLDAGGDTCLAGAYHRFGVVAYETCNGGSVAVVSEPQARAVIAGRPARGGAEDAGA